MKGQISNAIQSQLLNYVNIQNLPFFVDSSICLAKLLGANQLTQESFCIQYVLSRLRGLPRHPKVEKNCKPEGSFCETEFADPLTYPF